MNGNAGTEAAHGGSPTSSPLPCDLCGAQDADEVGTVDRQGRPLRTVICRRCGLVYADPIPATESLRDFYAGEYRLQYKGVRSPKLKHVYRAGKVAAQRIHYLAAYLRPDSVVIDVGSGGGEFVYLLRLSGFDARGVQPDDGYARYARDELGIPIHLGSALEIQLPAERCHMVTLFHSLEHMAAPSTVLAHIRQWLRPHGWLVIEVPNVEATCQAPGHRFHRAHLYNFSRASLQQLGRKAGFHLDRSDLSADGGNVTAVFRKATCAGPGSAELAGSYERTVQVMRGHTLRRHLSSIHPYARPFRRLGRALEEMWMTRQFSRGRDVLDSIRSERLAAPPG